MTFNNLLTEQYEAMYDDLKKRAYNKMKQFNLANELSEDCVQETFKRALAYKGNLKDEARVVGWINSIFNNVLRDMQRVEINRGLSLEFEEDLHDGQEMSVADQQLLKRLNELLEEKKDPEIRNIIYLKHFKGYKPSEIEKYSKHNSNYIRKILWEFTKEAKERYGNLIRG